LEEVDEEDVPHHCQVGENLPCGTVWIQRNDPCPCGNTYADTVWREVKGPNKGALILDKDGKPQERPVKFKHCCWSKYAVDEGSVMPELAKYRKKMEVYSKKHGRLPR
jgi:hypothetical protein